MNQPAAGFCLVLLFSFACDCDSDPWRECVTTPRCTFTHTHLGRRLRLAPLRRPPTRAAAATATSTAAIDAVVAAVAIIAAVVAAAAATAVVVVVVVVIVHDLDQQRAVAAAADSLEDARVLRARGGARATAAPAAPAGAAAACRPTGGTHLAVHLDEIALRGRGKWRRR